MGNTLVILSSILVSIAEDYAPLSGLWARFSRYFSTILNPHNSFTIVIGAGTLSWNVSGEVPDSVLFAKSFLAAWIASLSAQ